MYHLLNEDISTAYIYNTSGEVDESDMDRTAFISPFGTYYYFRLFGLQNTAVTLQCLIDKFQCHLEVSFGISILHNNIVISEIFDKQLDRSSPCPHPRSP